MPELGNPGRDRLLGCGWLGAALAFFLLFAAPARPDNETKRELALKHYEQAISQRLDIEIVPEDQRDPAIYQKVIDTFRRVYLTTPQSSKADDSLFAVAEIYWQMAQRFGAVPYHDRAIEAYRFLIREYPYSPFSVQARKKLEELESSAAPVLATAAAARLSEPSSVAVAAPESIHPAAPREQDLPRLTAVRHWSSPGLTRVIVDVEAEVKVHGERLTNPDRVYFDLTNVKLSPELKGKTLAVGDELVKQIRLAHTQAGVTRVVVDLNADVQHVISMLTNPPRVVVELRRRESAAAPAPGPPPVVAARMSEPSTPPAAAPKMAPPKAAEPTSRGERNLIRALGLKVGRVVIDAGHGGHDTGTIGPTGLMEKDLALDVATRLAALIGERIGSEVILTRTDDTFVPLEDRTALANEKQADLFISIHANSSSVRTVRGIETYYLNLTADREALDVAARENAASQKSIHELQDLVSKITLTEKISESREFAAKVQRSLHAAVSRENRTLRNRGVRQAPFVVLIGARMPSVLAEISFISNPRDEKLLKAPAYRQKIAEALYSGVAGYARTLSQVEVAAR